MPLQLAGAGVELNVLVREEAKSFPRPTKKGPGATETPGPCRTYAWAGQMACKRMCHHSLRAYHKRNMFSSGKRLGNEA